MVTAPFLSIISQYYDVAMLLRISLSVFPVTTTGQITQAFSSFSAICS
jgi:hypothetical protein